MSDSSKPRNETYTSDYSAVVCPYCGEKNDMAELIGMHGEAVSKYWCGECGEEFAVRVHLSISVTAEERT